MAAVLSLLQWEVKGQLQWHLFSLPDFATKTAACSKICEATCEDFCAFYFEENYLN